MVEILNDTKSSIVSEKDCEKVIQICVPKDRVLVELENMYNNLQQVAEVPGFRAGKAPRHVVMKYFKDKVEKDVLDKLISDAYMNSLKTLNLDPIDFPGITELKFEPGQPLEFKAKIEIKPEIKLTKYKGIKAKKESVEVKKEDAEKSLDYLRQRFAQFSTVEGRAAKTGDFVMIDFSGTVNGVADKNLTAVDYVVEVGTNKVLPELDSGILGMSSGDKKDITVEYKADFVNKDLAGKKAVYSITVKSIREKKLPELNDDFAKDVGEFKTLDELKRNIEDGLRKELEQKEKTRLVNVLVEEMVKSVNFSAPQSLIDREASHLIEEFESRMKQQNVSYEVIGKKKEDVEKEYKEIAVKRVKGFLVLEKVAELEKISVTEEDVDKEIHAFIARSGEEAASWSEYFKSEKGRESVRGQIQQDKVLDFLLASADLN